MRQEKFVAKVQRQEKFVAKVQRQEIFVANLYLDLLRPDRSVDFKAKMKVGQ